LYTQHQPWPHTVNPFMSVRIIIIMRDVMYTVSQKRRS